MKIENLEYNVYQLLDTLGYKVYDSEAEKDAKYPYIIYNFRKINLGFSSRNDFVLEINVWDELLNYSRVNMIADKIQNLLSDLNNPDDKVLTTYYLESREKVEDENKKIKRVQLVFSAPSYFL